MNVTTISEPKDIARQKYEEYREGLRDREATPEDTGILMGYAALAAGKTLIDLSTTVRASPVDDRGLPKLAAARANWTWCHFDRGDVGQGMFMSDERAVGGLGWGRVAWHRRIIFPAGTFQATKLDSWAVRRCRALVPLIPPNLRPKKALHRYVILFEAEWQPVPPTDPMLLRHLHGTLYVVLAAWDLTPLERAVLAGRLTQPN